MNYIDQQKMKQVNGTHILKLIRENEGLTRRELERISFMSWGAVSQITSKLMEDKYIIEQKLKNDGAGRTPSGLFLNPNEHFTLGLDINRSGMRAVLINLKNEIIGSIFEQIQTTAFPEFLDNIVEFAKKGVGLANSKHILGVGVAMQGEVDSKNGISIRFPGCEGWENLEISKILSEQFGTSVFTEHDPNCIIYAYSAESDCKDAVMIRADKGVGMAMMIDGEIFNRQGSLEIAHIAAYPCNDDKFADRLESYASQSGIESALNNRFENIACAARSGDDKCIGFFKKTADALSFATANFCTMMNIQNVVLCGDLFYYKDLFYDGFVSGCEKYCPNGSRPVFTETDVKNAARGAALIAADKMIEKIYSEEENQ